MWLVNVLMLKSSQIPIYDKCELTLNTQHHYVILCICQLYCRVINVVLLTNYKY